VSTERTTVPADFTIGESLAWKKSFSLYPADSWTLKYYFRGAGAGFDVTATADGTDFLCTVPKTATAACAAGRYSYQAFAEKSAEKILVDAGEITAIASLADLTTEEEFDGRSEIKKTLDAIDARLKGDVSKGVLEYTIGDRQLKRYSLKELADLRGVYARLYAAEVRAARGGGILKQNYVRFSRPR
jgi:hypothetical protein